MTKEENIKFKEEIINYQFLHGTGYKLNLENPQTFNEKLQWLKLYNQDPLISKCADKYLVREYIKETIGEEYLIPLIGVWDKVDDIDFESLPNQFVLKVNWGSGQNIVVKDKEKLDLEETKKKLRYWMQPTSNHYYFSYEWGYKNIAPKIICEKYMKDNDTDNLIVYGVYTFSNEPHFIHTITDAHTGLDRCNIYDINWNKLDLTYIFNNTDYEIKKPKNLDLILSLSKKLSKNFLHVRVDFFSINDKVYAGELTFYTNNGTTPFNPIEWDYKFGELIKLPKEKKLEYDFIDKDTLLQQVSNLEPIVKQYKDLEQEYIHIKQIYEEQLHNFSKKNIIFNLFSINTDEKYITIMVLGIKIVLKRRPDQTRPDQTRPDQTRPDQTRPIIICSDYILFYNNINRKHKKLQPMLQYQVAA